MALPKLRLANLPASAKLTLTFFLALVGLGYFTALGNIYYQHKDKDLEEGLTLNDLKRTFHGLDKEVTTESRQRFPSPMELMVRPGGPMREYLEAGGPKAVRALMSWLEAGSPEATFDQPGAYQTGDPAARQVIADQCVRCHNAADGEMQDVPYAPAPDAEPVYANVILLARSRFGDTTTETETMHLAPTGLAELMHITHAHVLAMPLFTLSVAALFLMTGLPEKLKLILAPLPMLALIADIGGWWLARPVAPAVYIIAAAGAVFGAAYGLQILIVLGSMWFGRRTTT